MKNMVKYFKPFSNVLIRYPFGMLMGESTGGDEQPYKYGGKELTRDAGMDLCDFEARQMDNLRFLSPDPLAHENTVISTLND